MPPFISLILPENSARLRLSALLLFVILVSPPPARGALTDYHQRLAEGISERIRLTARERAWLDAHAGIRIGIDSAYAPYSYLDEDGNFTGVVPDYLDIFEAALGLRFEPVRGLEWPEILDGAREGRLDAIATAASLPERRDFLEFTQVYLPTPLVIAARENNAGEVNAPEKLAGKRVAVVRGYATTERLAEQPGIVPLPVESPLAGLQAVAAGEADAFVGVIGVITYLARHHGLTNLTIAGGYQMNDNGQRFAVREDWPELAAILDKALDLIPPADRNRLLEPWVPVTINGAAAWFEPAERIVWTPEEQAWLDRHPRITMGINNAWPPMNFIGENGLPRGIGVDFINAINKRLDGAVQIVPDSWENIYRAVKEKRLDALMDITPRNDREPHFSFTDPYIKVPHVFITREDRPYIASLYDLKGKSLAVEEGFYLNTILKNDYPGINIHSYETTGEALDAVVDGRSYAYAGNRAVATYIMRNEVIANLEIHGKLRVSASINAIGVRKDAPILRDILQKVLDDISLRERLEILEAWTLANRIVSASELNLTEGEWKWLEDHPTIRIAADPAFPPIEFSDVDGHAMGISTEYVDILADVLGVRFVYSTDVSWQEAVDQLERRELDMYSAAAATPVRERYASFTAPYLKVPAMIFTRQRSPFISSLSDFAGKKVAMVKDYAVTEMVENDNWEMEITPVADIVSGLQAVRSGEADAFIGNALSASYYIRREAFTDIHIAGPTPYRLELAMGVRNDWPEFVAILNKALQRISEPERAQIAARWIGLQVQEPADYSLFWQLLAAGILLLLLILAWNWYLRYRLGQHTAEIRGQNLALEQRQRQLADAQRIARLGSWHLDLDTGKFTASEMLRDILGVPDREALSSLEDYLGHVEEKDRDFVATTIRKSIDAGAGFEMDYSLRGPDGERIFVQEVGEVESTGGRHGRVSSTVQDVSERRLAESTIFKLQQAFEKSPGAIVISDLENRIEYVNDAFSRTTGYSSREVIGRDSVSILAPANLRDDYRQIVEAARNGKVWHGELLSNRKNGEPFWEDVTIAPVIDDDGNVANLLELRQDISSRKAIEERLFNEVNFCPLTRLPNQANILQQLNLAAEAGQSFSLLFVNLLNLKRINDGLGFEAGDALIIQAGRRLDGTLARPDTLAHLGGGQYLLKLSTGDTDAIEQQVETIFSRFRFPYRVGDEEISQSICIGVARCPRDGTDPQELLSRANVAANKAKKEDSVQWSYFSREYSQQTQNKFHMENLLAQALNRNELYIVYQPKIDLATSRHIGVEALLRWDNAELGQVPPNQFIPVAEQNDLIIRIGRWVIHEGIRQARQWQQEGYENFALAINLSPKQFLDTSLVAFIHDCLKETGFDGQLLELELTESLLMESSEKINSQMEKLKHLGIKLVLDDFGTGFSSLSYLQQFPFDGLKIDRSFIYDYPRFQGNVGLIKAIIAMGKALNMSLVAEGIETQEQADFLVAEDCHVFQGYLYGKPMNDGDFSRWMNERQITV